MRILVTGAAGFIGSHTVDRLLAAGHQVSGVDNFRTGRRENLAAALRSPGFSLHEFDMREVARLEALAAAFADVLVHLAALVSVPESIREPELNFSLNVAAAHTAAMVASRHGVKRFVFASSAAVYGSVNEPPIRENARTRPESPYGAAKLAAEALLLAYAQSYGMVVRAQRYFNVYGSRQDPSSPYSGVISAFLARLRAGEPVILYGDGLQTRDFIDVDDVARANELAATKLELTSGCANICTGQRVSLRQLLELLGAHFPSRAAPRIEPARPGDVRHSGGDPAEALRTLGFSARIELAAGGLERLLEASGPRSSGPAGAAG